MDENVKTGENVGEDRFHLLYGKDQVIFAELPSEVDDWIVFEAVRRKSLRGNLKGSRKKRKNSSDFKEVYLDDPQYNPMEGLGTEDNFLKRYQNFKKFDTVVDCSNHDFSAESSAI
ncbi:hypothetical protein Tco_0015127 [Tanacetum coccineum]